MKILERNILFQSLRGSTLSMVARRGSTILRPHNPPRKKVPPTEAQLLCRQAYKDADCVWRWLGLWRRMQWRKAQHRRDVSGYEFFMRINIPWLTQSKVAILTPPRKGAYSTPPYPFYLTNAAAVWPYPIPGNVDNLTWWRGYGAGLEDSADHAFQHALEEALVDSHVSQFLTNPGIEIETNQWGDRWRVRVIITSASWQHRLPLSARYIPPSHITGVRTLFRPRINVIAPTARMPLWYNRRKLRLYCVDRYINPRRHPSLLVPWELQWPDCSQEDWLPPNLIEAHEHVRIFDPTFTPTTVAARHELYHYTPLLGDRPAGGDTHWRHMPPYYPNHPLIRRWPECVDQAVDPRYNP